MAARIGQSVRVSRGFRPGLLTCRPVGAQTPNPFPLRNNKGLEGALVIIPDGRISRVRLATLATVRNDAFPLPPRLKSASPHTPLAPPVYDIARHRSTSLRTTELVGSVSLSGAHHDVHQAPRAPLPSSGVTWRGVAFRLPRRASPLFPCSYGLMRQTKPPPTSSVSLADGSLQVVASPCWEMALPDVISARLSLDAWTRTRSRFAGKRRSGRQMLGESAVKSWPCAKRPGWPSSVSRP
jgi:hypothetical protein